jgi:GH35 family endo-1,4-beta-xylanase
MGFVSRALLVAAFLPAVAAPAIAGRAQPRGFPLIAADPMTAFRTSTPRATTGVVDAVGPGFTRAIRIDVRQPGATWDVELTTRITQAVARGDVALLAFSARRVGGGLGSGEAYFTVYAQRAAPPYEKSLLESFAVNSDWQTFALPFNWGLDFAADQASVNFGLGAYAQTVEIGGIRVLGYKPGTPLSQLPSTPFTYAGRAANDPWRAEAAARIEAIRKGDLVIEVRGPDRQPVAGADVRIEQRRHAFAFGSALIAQRLTAPPPGGGQTDDNVRYRETVERLFNAGTLENDTKWPPWEGDWGAAFNQPQTLAALDWTRARGIRMRGHVLVWPGWGNLPQSIQRLRGTPDAARTIPPLVLAHIDDITQRTATWFDEWDVVNEPFTNHDLMDLGGNQLMVDWFRRARANLPRAGLALNDYDILERHGGEREHQDHFEATARFLIQSGAPITTLGLQGHFGNSVTSMATVRHLLDRYAALGLALRITEFDVNTADEQLQADYTRDFLTLVFSHPAVVGFQAWGFWEGAHWLPRAAMYRRDWTEKPNGAVFRRLIQETWHTDVSGPTDGGGRFGTRAFYGRYDVTVTWGQRTRTVSVDHVRGDGPTIVPIDF